MPRSRLFLTLVLLCAASSGGIVGTGTASASGGGGVAGIHFVSMPMLDVPIVETGRSTGRLRMKLTLNAADADGARTIEAELSSLRETALAAAGEFARLRASPYLAVDAGRLSQEMTGAIRAREHAVTEVLLVEVSSTRI